MTWAEGSLFFFLFWKENLIFNLAVCIFLFLWEDGLSKNGLSLSMFFCIDSHTEKVRGERSLDRLRKLISMARIVKKMPCHGVWFIVRFYFWNGAKLRIKYIILYTNQLWKDEEDKKQYKIITMSRMCSLGNSFEFFYINQSIIIKCYFLLILIIILCPPCRV